LRPCKVKAMLLPCKLKAFSYQCQCFYALKALLWKMKLDAQSQ
jgi:hypothetical protein